MSTDTIIASDLGRYKSVACFCASANVIGSDFKVLQDVRSARPGIFGLIQLGWP